MTKISKTNYVYTIVRQTKNFGQPQSFATQVQFKSFIADHGVLLVGIHVCTYYLVRTSKLLRMHLDADHFVGMLVCVAASTDADRSADIL